MATVLSLCLVGLFVHTLAIPWSGDPPTLPFGKALVDENGWTPKPTAAQQTRVYGSEHYHFPRFRLFGRQQRPTRSLNYYPTPSPHPPYVYTPPSPLPHNSKGVSAGAIAGGVVGGLVLLTLVVLFLVLHKRKTAKNEPMPYLAASAAPQEGPGGGPHGEAPLSPIPFTDNKPYSYNDIAAPQSYYEMGRMQQGNNAQYGGTRHDLQPEPTYYAMGPYYPGQTNSMGASDEVRDNTTSPSSALLSDSGYTAPSVLSESAGAQIYEAPAGVPGKSGRFEAGGLPIYDSSGAGASHSNPRNETAGW